MDFDHKNSHRKTYKLNKDYNNYARMTTFNGQAVLIGLVTDHNGQETQARKYVEVFDKGESEWLLKIRQMHLVM